jgi:hypothetical protein
VRSPKSAGTSQGPGGSQKAPRPKQQARESTEEAGLGRPRGVGACQADRSMRLKGQRKRLDSAIHEDKGACRAGQGASRKGTPRGRRIIMLRPPWRTQVEGQRKRPDIAIHEET